MRDGVYNMCKETKKVSDDESHLQLGAGDCSDSSCRVKKKKRNRNFESWSNVVNVKPSQVAVAIEACTEARKQKEKVKKKVKRLESNAEDQRENIKRNDKGSDDYKDIIKCDNASIGDAAGEKEEGLQLNNNLLGHNALKPAKEKKKKKRKHEEIKGDSLVHCAPCKDAKFANGGTQIATEGDGCEKEGSVCVENQDSCDRKNKKKQKREADCDSQLKKTIDAVNGNTVADVKTNKKNKRKFKSKKKKQKREDDYDSQSKNNIDAGDGNAEVDGKTNKKKNKKFEKNGLSDVSVDIAPKETQKKVSFSDHLEVFPAPDKLCNDRNQSGRLVRGKRFTKEEDEIVKNAVLGYIDEHQLGEKEGLDMVLNCQSHRRVRGCWKDIAAAIPWRHRRSVYHRAHVLFESGLSGSWTPEELDIVQKFYEKHGPKWKELANQMGRYMIHVKDAWIRNRMKNRNKGHWTQEEYQNLFELVNKDLRLKIYEEKKTKHGMLRDNIAWEAISDMFTRRGKDCCEKWYSRLTSPMVFEGCWTDSDDYRLIQALVDLDACCIEDVDWDNVLGHRSGDLCLKRWKQMSRHLGAYRTKSFAEQVEILAKRYCPEMAEVRDIIDSRPIVDADDGSQ